MSKGPSLAAQALAGLFRLWQLTFSAIMPPSCRFTPSCSAYGIEAVKRHGALAGGWLAVKRVARCNPWGGLGLDPVPECLHRNHAGTTRPGSGA